MKDKVQKIREGIEKLKSQLLRGACASQIAMETRCKEEAYNEVLSILDSLQEEPSKFDAAIQECDDVRYNEDLGCRVNLSQLKRIAKKEEPVNDDLDSFAIKYAQDKPYPVTVCQAVKVGANWQKEKDAKLIINAKEDGYRLGLATMKQQMMKEAVEGDITFDYYGDDDKTYGCIAHDSFCLEDFGLKDTDKVKMILIKED